MLQAQGRQPHGVTEARVHDVACALAVRSGASLVTRQSVGRHGAPSDSGPTGWKRTRAPIGSVSTEHPLT